MITFIITTKTTATQVQILDQALGKDKTSPSYG